MTRLDRVAFGKRRWQPFLLLLLVFFAASSIAVALPTPGSWSDRRSQWIPAVALAVTALATFVAGHWIFRRRGVLFKVQALIVWGLCGVVLVGSISSLYESWVFLSEVGGNHS